MDPSTNIVYDILNKQSFINTECDKERYKIKYEGFVAKKERLLHKLSPKKSRKIRKETYLESTELKYTNETPILL